MKPRHDLIVFDWDGTLMDSVVKIVRCFTAALDDVGAPHPGEDATRHVIGLGLSEAVIQLLPGVDDGTRAGVIERYRQHFLHLDQTEMPLFPGVRAGLEALAAKGYLLAVATGKAR
ncbi:MAG: HAD hydrolase-like protein, partial [Burkholderiales bacterium]|nr:HAD hydrolase-like protein [Burkholderiales bacterium]